MVLPMPAEDIATVHQLFITCNNSREYFSRTKDGKAIDSTNDPEDKILEITGVYTHQNYHSPDVTGVESVTEEENGYTTLVQNE